MKAAIYSPYWDTYGGGEKYTAAVVKTLLDHDYSVDMWWPKQSLLVDVESRYGINISAARLDQKGYQTMTTAGWWQKKQLQQSFDLLFWVSDGSIPWLWARRNFIHFQVPFHHPEGIFWWDRMKLKGAAKVICNSIFTKHVIDQAYGVESSVVYPPATMFAAGKKEKVIISVGRFDNLMQSKRQDVLIEAFEQLKRDGWRLVLAGGVLHGSENVNRLRTLVGENKQIEIVTNPPFNQLKKMYETASIYWHAAGYGMDLTHHPEKAEHFGITTVEAMSAGAVPIVFNGGGQREIVIDQKNGFLWETPEQLVALTRKIIDSANLCKKISDEAQLTAHRFSLKEFGHAWEKYID